MFGANLGDVALVFTSFLLASPTNAFNELEAGLPHGGGGSRHGKWRHASFPVALSFPRSLPAQPRDLPVGSSDSDLSSMSCLSLHSRSLFEDIVALSLGRGELHQKHRRASTNTERNKTLEPPVRPLPNLLSPVAVG